MEETEAERRLRTELLKDERILWAGRPAIWPLFSGGDLFWVPMGIFLVAIGAGPIIEYFRSDNEFRLGIGFFIVWVLFVLWGLYQLGIRFVLKGLARARTSYAVTNKRVLVLRTFPGRSLGAIYIDSIGTVTKELNRHGRGNIMFGNNPMGRMAEEASFLFPPFGPPAPAFINISDAETVYQLIDSLRQKADKVAGE